MTITVGGAWAQGAAIPGFPKDAEHRGMETASLFDAAQSYVTDFPVLARAVHGMRPIDRTKIEWDSPAGTVTNYTQINRTPWSEPQDGEDERESFLFKHLAGIEQTLLDGIPGRQRTTSYYLQTCGGVRHYLGRDFEIGDHIMLRPLHSRELNLRSWQRPGGSWEREWLSEYTLEVNK